jgi:two-component system sensor histidine kinase DesK
MGGQVASDVELSRRLQWLAAPAAVAYCAAFPIIQVGLVVGGWEAGGWVDAALAAAVTVCYLPLYLHLVVHAVRGSRPTRGVWMLAAITALILGALPVIGSIWLPTLHVVAVSALIVLRFPWSILAVAGVVIAQAPLVVILGSSIPEGSSYYTITVVWRTSAVFVPLLLISTIGLLHALREQLAEEALVRERLRIDREMGRTVGTALEAIAARGEEASTLVGRDHAALAGELGCLVDESRRTLAGARRMIQGYQHSSLWAELDNAMNLLVAAGIEARLVVQPEARGDHVDEALRSELRRVTARLLHDDSTRAWVVTVGRDNGRVQLEARPLRHESDARTANIGVDAGRATC